MKRRVVLKDSFGRRIRDLRISVTDRCNFRCFYCKSKYPVHYRERDEILTFEEIERLTRLFLEFGVEKVRITGGEPLLRRGIEELVGRLARLPFPIDLALTTNGFNLFKWADRFRRNGLDRVTVSLDSLREDRFLRITGSRDFRKVLRSIDAALEADLRPVKINCVPVRGLNDDEILDFVEFARQKDVTVRFIEFMPIDEDEGWTREQVVTGEEIRRRISERYRLAPRAMCNESETARNFDLEGGRGRIGLIMPVSRPFCGECSRIRLTADGKLRTCLFSLVEHDIKGLLRSGASDDELRTFIAATVEKKERGHRINESDFVPPSRSMSYIGG